MPQTAERTPTRNAWTNRLQMLLAAVGASKPEDHPWVVEARWLLDNAPPDVMGDREGGRDG